MIIFAIFSAILVQQISGHGMMLDPASRSSLWRFNSDAPVNYDDNQVYCGGATMQNQESGGRCGVCGDAFINPHPQDNENTGKYGQGLIARVYESGSVIDVHVNLTTNHMGSFNYSLCVLPDPNQPEPEECFQWLQLEDGTENFPVESGIQVFINRVQLPAITCERCVLRWTYRGGNSWGTCPDGTQAEGCGPQEHFRNCADISIV